MTAIVDGRTFEAIVFDWDPPDSAGSDDAGALRERVEALCSMGVHLFVRCGDVANVTNRLGAAPKGPGRLFFWDRDQPWSTQRQAADWLRARGVTGALILFIDVPPTADREAPPIAGFERAIHVTAPTPTRRGSDWVVQLIDAQLARRRARRVPDIDDDPAWVVTLPQERTLERTAEALGTLGNGHAAIRAAREEGGRGSLPLFAVQGVYTPEPAPTLIAGPVWTCLTAQCTDDVRLLDMRTGVLQRVAGDHSGLKTLHFVSAARPEAFALRAEGRADSLGLRDPFATTSDGTGPERQDRGPLALARTATAAGGISVAVEEWHHQCGGTLVIDRVGAWAADPISAPSWDQPAALLSSVDKIGFDRLLAEHRHAWGRRWADAAVTIAGAPDDELAARFAIFHLLSAAPDHGEAAVGARGLSGAAYGGHVFWDADVFVLPALAAIHPQAARAMLEYRIRRLGAARQIASRHGAGGARFPWESARSGEDVTPRVVSGQHGEIIPIHTAEREEHIVADVAWAANHYARWTGDEQFRMGPGSALLLETARYWADRVHVDINGSGHIAGVMGPDEYHQTVDDNAFTNVMARWNLRAAAQLADELGEHAVETARWRRVAECLVDGYDHDRQLYQQFDGYWALEALLAADVAPPPVAADLLLGVERVTGSQLIKQADVLMLHHLVPDEVVPGSLGGNLAFYDARTVHGSSLSPAVHASLLARAGQPDRALELFRLAARLDLDDTTGTTAGGLHLAAMGGVWQALAFGFLGLHVRADVLEVDPCLPDEWDALSLRLLFRGNPLGVRAEHGAVTISCTSEVMVRIRGREPYRCVPPGATFSSEGETR